MSKLTHSMTGEEIREAFKRTGAICPVCHGNGYIAVDVNDAGDGPAYDDCWVCNSEGEFKK